MKLKTLVIGGFWIILDGLLTASVVAILFFQMNRTAEFPIFIMEV